MGMQTTMFQALKSVNITDDTAEKVVDQIESHIAMKISEANAPLIAELRMTRETMREGMSTLRWLLAASISLSVISATIGGYAATLAAA